MKRNISHNGLSLLIRFGVLFCSLHFGSGGG